MENSRSRSPSFSSVPFVALVVTGCWPDHPVQHLTQLLVWKGIRLLLWVQSGVQGQGCSNLASSAKAATLGCWASSQVVLSVRPTSKQLLQPQGQVQPTGV